MKTTKEEEPITCAECNKVTYMNTGKLCNACYMKNYRKKNPDYVKRNLEQTEARRRRRRELEKTLK